MAAAQATVHALASRAAECESLIVAETVRLDARVVHLVGHPGARLRDLATRFILPDDVRGVTTDTAEGVVTLAGDAAIVDTADALGMEKTDPALATRPLSWTRRAASFFQGNRYLVGALARRVAELGQAERVADFYSGVGLFALTLAARGARVVAVEGDPISGEDLEANAAEWRDRVDVVRAAVESVLDETPSTRPEVVVVDPPRSGLSPQATAGVIRWNAPRVVYVSCDPPTLARDAALLVKAGYQLRSLEGFDFFPNTPHVETLAVFDQRP
jgi:23S rRNA (uracil1939-C5)-methyltransferase